MSSGGFTMLFLALISAPAANMVAAESVKRPAFHDDRKLPAARVTLTIESEPAKAVLRAIRNPRLDLPSALRVARLPANAASIERAAEFAPTTSERDFAAALVAAARGRQVSRPAETIYEFAALKPRASRLLQLIAQIDSASLQFKQRAQQKVQMFSPPGLSVPLDGHIIAGGPSGGFTLGGTSFYLNVGVEDDLDSALAVMTHELYHAVQGAAKEQQARFSAQTVTPAGGDRTCQNAARLFQDLYDEGSAEPVGDQASLVTSAGEESQRMYRDFSVAVKRKATSFTLLELSATDLKDAKSVSYKQVYDLGFLGNSILYTAGYVMAKAIVNEDGPEGLASFASRPGYAFAQRYVQLPGYGTAPDLPKLGPNTEALINHLSSGCSQVP